MLPNRGACLAAIRAALDAGQDVDARGRRGFTPLHSAMSKSDAEAVKAVVAMLVAAGADLRAKDTLGMEPLHYAALNRNAEAAAAAVAALVEAGAVVRAKDSKGVEPLHIAAVYPNAEPAAALVTALVAAGADLNCAMSDGRRPLHEARHMDTALLLVRLGASLSLRDNLGRTALEAAAGGSASAQAALRQASISERRCAGCGAGGERLKRCIRCRAVSYCK